jgi:hypothetical protein
MGGAGEHPSTDALSDYAEGKLDAGSRAALEAHLTACSLCRAIAGGMGAAPPPLSPAPGPTPGPAQVPGAPTAPGPSVGSGPAAPASPGPSAARGRLWILLALVAGLAVGAWWVFGRSGSGGTGGASAPPARLEDVLTKAAGDVVIRHPDLFPGFTPLDAETLKAARPDAAGGGIAAIGPREVVLSTRPTFRWHASGRAQVHTLALKGADGKEAWSKRIDGVGTPFPADAPELARGSSWTWSVKARRQTGPVEGTLSFRVAGEEEAKRFEAQAKAVREIAPASVADLLLAHVALRAGLLEEAERLLVNRAGGKPKPGIEAETLAYVRARLGLDAGK